MNESHSDDELLALLQPPSMPNEFGFESTLPINGDAPDDDDDTGVATLPGPAPPAPMAPMMEAYETGKEDSALLDGAPASSPDPVTGDINGLGSPQPVNGADEIDEDEIAYEPIPIKTPSRTTRSTRAQASASRPRTKPRTKPTPVKSKAKPREKSASQKSDTEPEQEQEPPAQSPSQSQQQPQTQPKPPSPSPEPPKIEFEIVINRLPPQATQEYQPVPPGDEVYRVLDKIPTGSPGETWLSVEFEDGRIDQVSPCLPDLYGLKKTKKELEVYSLYRYWSDFLLGSLRTSFLSTSGCFSLTQKPHTFSLSLSLLLVLLFSSLDHYFLAVVFSILLLTLLLPPFLVSHNYHLNSIKHSTLQGLQKL